jgi:mRNA interferase MazF
LIRRGEIRWYTFRPPDKRRPVLILTRDSIASFLGEVTVAPLTSVIRDIPSEVVLGPLDGLPRNSAVNLDHLQTVPRARIGGVISKIAAGRLDEVQRALLFALGFDHAAGR